MSTPQVDPRGQRFTAAVNLLGLAAALLVAPSRLTELLLAALALGFGVGAFAGPHRSPWAVLFKRVVRPRLGPPHELEDPAPPRFAAGVGLAFTLVALAGYLYGATLLGAAATGVALAAAFLNAVFGLCLGCEVYLLSRRLRASSPTRIHGGRATGTETDTDTDTDTDTGGATTHDPRNTEPHHETRPGTPVAH